MINLTDKTIATYDSLGVLSRKYVCETLRKWLRDEYETRGGSFDENAWYVRSIVFFILGLYAPGEQIAGVGIICLGNLAL